MSSNPVHHVEIKRLTGCFEKLPGLGVWERLKMYDLYTLISAV